MDAEATSTSAPRDLHPLLERPLVLTASARVDAANFDDWTAQPGFALLVFTEDPLPYRETLDLAVIVLELTRLRAAPPTRPPSIGIAVTAPAQSSGSCHRSPDPIRLPPTL